MRPRIFSLMLVLCTILIAPAIVTSCEQANAAQKEHVYLADATNPAAAAVLVTTQETTTATVVDNNQNVVQDTLSANQVTDANTATVAQDIDNMFGWKNIFLLGLGIVSTLFAALWRRASNVIHEIDAALKDGKVDKSELNRIIQAWKA